MSAEREPIGVIGTGYVGLVTAAGFAELGSEVFCVDIDEAKIRGLREGRIPIWEPGLEELVAKNRERLHFDTALDDALEHARLLFVAVGTPPTYSGDADLSAVHAVVDAMPPSDRHALVMKSTVPCGTGENIKRVFGEQGKGGFRYVSCPEFLKEGSAVRDFLEPDRVVIGDDGDWAGDAVQELYAPLDAPLVRTDIRSAEMVKLASNAFLATKISFINEIANVCEETGADVIEVARGMGLDDRIGAKFLQAGIGFGGSCFPPSSTALPAHISSPRAERGVHRASSVVLGPARPTRVAARVGAHAAPLRRDMIEVRTKMGRRVRATADHGFLVGTGRDDELLTRMAAGPRRRAAGCRWRPARSRLRAGAEPMFPKDVQALKQLAGNSGYHFQLLTAVIEVNELQKRRVMNKLQKHLGSLVDKDVALLGLAFKPNTDDMREASSLVLSARLNAAGRARARVRPGRRGRGAQADPRRAVLARPRWTRSTAPTRSCSSRSGRSSPSSTSPRSRRAMRGTLLVDGRNFLDVEAARAAGLTYEGIGRPSVNGGGTGLVQALILAGGEGTRLRPLTSTVPKPVVPLVDRPFIVFMLDWLRSHGVDDVVMSCGHLAVGRAQRARRRLGVRRAPALHGGAAAARHRRRAQARRADARRALPDAQRRRADRHRHRRAARAARGRGRARDARARAGRGPVRVRARAHAAQRRRSPSSSRSPRPTRSTRATSPPASTCSSARVLDLLEPDQPASIEREVFPQLVGDGLYGCVSEAYWLDIGTPERYLRGTFDILEGAVGTGVAERMGQSYLCVEQNVENAGRIIPSALVESGCRIAEGARIGGRAVLERGVTIGEGTLVERAVIMQGAEIGAHCTLRGCIVAGGVRIGDHTHVDGLSVIGEGATIGAHNIIANGARMFPGVTLPDRRCSSDDARATLNADAVAAVDSTGQAAEICDLGIHLRDALWRVDSAGARRPRRARRPGRGRHGRLGRRRLPRARRAPAIACGGRCSSPTATSCRRGSARTRSCCARATRAPRRRRSPATTPPRAVGARSSWPRPAAPLAERARRDRVPVIPLPGGLPAAGGGRLLARGRAGGGGAGRRRPVAARRGRGGRRAGRGRWPPSGGRTPATTARPRRSRGGSTARCRCSWAPA